MLAELVALVGHTVLCHEQRQLVAAPETLQCKLEMIGLHCPAEIIWRRLRVVYAVAIDTITKVIINGNVITLPHHLAQEIIVLEELHHPRCRSAKPGVVARVGVGRILGHRHLKAPALSVEDFGYLVVCVGKVA